MKKQCHKCHNVYDIVLFNNDQKTPDGKSHRCRICISLIRNPKQDRATIEDRLLRFTERRLLAKKGKRRCTRCKKIKIIKDGFYGGTSPRWVVYCKVCSNEVRTEYVNAPHRRTKYRLANRVRRQRDPVALWIKHTLTSHTKRGFSIGVTEDDLRQLIAARSCSYCEVEVIVGCNASVDQVIPKGGFVKNNVVLCCKPCNSTKALYSGAEYRKILREQVGLLDDLRTANERLLCVHYAMQIPLEILRGLANGQNPRQA